MIRFNILFKIKHLLSMSEIWMDIKDFEGLYQVSNLGRVRSLDKIILQHKYGASPNLYRRKGKILKQAITKEGYYMVSLFDNNKGKSYLVHRLVATAFILNPNNYRVVNHKDENKLNNNLDNLEWCTDKYNLNYGGARERLSKSCKGRIPWNKGLKKQNQYAEDI